jgi:hypothetical protein
MLKPNFAFSALFLITIASCGKKGDSWSYALSPGTYSLQGPFCESTGLPPEYDEVAKRINLFDFSNAKQHSLSFEESGLFRVIASDTCTMTVKHAVAENKDNFFALQLARSFTFEPAGCSLQALIGTTAYNVSSESSLTLQNSIAVGSDLPFEITRVEPNVIMTTANREELNNVWLDYGCASPDRIKWVLTQKSSG